MGDPFLRRGGIHRAQARLPGPCWKQHREVAIEIGIVIEQIRGIAQSVSGVHIDGGKWSSGIVDHGTGHRESWGQYDGAQNGVAKQKDIVQLEGEYCRCGSRH